MNASDHSRMEAANAKKRRKLERYTNTPQAKARRAEMDKDFDTGIPISPPTDPYPDPEEI